MSSNNSVLVFVCYSLLTSYGIWCIFKEIYLKIAARRTILFVLPFLLGLKLSWLGCLWIKVMILWSYLILSFQGTKFCSQVLDLYDSFIDKPLRLHKLWFVTTSYCHGSVMSSCLLPLHSFLYFALKWCCLFFSLLLEILYNPLSTMKKMKTWKWVLKGAQK